MANRWAVLIGVDGYHESLGALRFCANDAKLMQEILTSDCCGFVPDNVILLTDDQPKDRVPTFGNIHSWLGTWLSRSGPDDLVLAYFAGHGREANGQALLAPLDATLESLPVTGIPIQYVRDLLDRCRAGQKVLILDACHSGAGRDVATMTTSFREALDVGKGLYTIASCDADQISHEWPEKHQGVFTHYLVEAVRHGAPAEADGRVTLDRVYEWTRNGIVAWTADKRLKQEPVRICRVRGDIHIATRPLTVEQRLAAAMAEISVQKATIAKLQERCASADVEKSALDSTLEGLRMENRRLSENVRGLQRTASANRPKRTVAEVQLPDWQAWRSSRWPVTWEHDVGAIIGYYVFGLMVGGLVAFGATVLLHPAVGILVIVVLGGSLLGIHVRGHLALKNEYCLMCAEACLKAYDYVQGSAYAFDMRRMGVRQVRGRAVVVSLGDLAAENGDSERARLLYECGWKLWKSPHAKRALEERAGSEHSAESGELT